MHRQIRDMHAALNEAGILYVTLMVHDGWDEPGPSSTPIRYVERGNLRERDFPIISRKGRADGGHAVAIVGYTAMASSSRTRGAPDWGSGGFALLPYEDYLLHATDVWVAQLGVPVAVDLWERARHADTTAGSQRAADNDPARRHPPVRGRRRQQRRALGRRRLLDDRRRPRPPVHRG